MNIVERIIEKDILVYCKSASSFPNGVKAAHEFLHSHFPLDPAFQYFGLSGMDQNQIWYKAGISGIQSEKAMELQLEKMIIKSGRYAMIHIDGFMKNTSQIGKAFDELFSKTAYDPDMCAVEWYNDIEQVDCMVKIISND